MMWDCDVSMSREKDKKTKLCTYIDIHQGVQEYVAHEAKPHQKSVFLKFCNYLYVINRNKPINL